VNKKELLILEKAFAAGIDQALSGTSLGIIQTKSKLAVKLAEQGFLELVTIRLGGRIPVLVTGYQLTLLGNFTYCSSDLCSGKA